MTRTYNGRFSSPAEPKGGGKWVVIGLITIPLWKIPILGVPIMAGGICCLVKGGKMNSEKRMHQRFHEYCAIIGMRTRVPVRELAKMSEMGRKEMSQYLQKMIAKGYFGGDAYLDVSRDELVLPAPKAGAAPQNSTASWKDLVFEVLHALRADQAFQDHAQDAAYEKAAQQPEPEAEPKQEAQKKPVADAKKKTYMDELEKTLNELYQLNAQIEDEAVSGRIDRIGELTAGIFRAVIENPEREQDVRKFMNYYLPTTLKLLKSYEMLEEQSYQGENIAASRKKIEAVLDMLIEAYEKQLDRLFHNDALDIATDIDVLETMMAGDGLSSKGQMRMGL